MDTAEFKTLINRDVAEIAERADADELRKLCEVICQKSDEVSRAECDARMAGDHEAAKKLWKLYSKMRKAMVVVLSMSDFARSPQFIAAGILPSPARYWADARIKA